MVTDIHRPIQREKRDGGKSSYIGFVISTVLFIVMFLLTVYTYRLGESLWVATEFTFAGVILFGFFMYIGWKGIKKESAWTTQFVLDETGITNYYTNETWGKEDSAHIPFGNMKRVLMGNYADYISAGSNTIPFYRFHVLFIVIHKDGTYFELLSTKEELTDWINRFQDKGIPIYFTDLDLYQALVDVSTHDVDFTQVQVQGVPWEKVSEYPLIGEESTDNPYRTWEHDGEKNPQVDKDIRKDTNKAEKRNLLFLFINALFVGAFMLSIDSEGIFAVNDVTLGILLVNVIFPIIMVYMRRYSKWYMPFIYFLIVSIGELIGMLVAAPFFTLPGWAEIIQGVALLNVMVLVMGWYPILIIIKVAKFIFGWMHERKIRLP